MPSSRSRRARIHTSFTPRHSPNISASRLPITLTLEGGGAAPAIMVDMARNMIEGGSATTVLIVSADMPLSVNTRDSYVNTLADSGPVHPDIERPFGPTVPSLFGMVAHAYMNEFGADETDLGAVALHDRAAAITHPNSHMRAPMDFASYRASHMIADPLRLLDCSPVSDGGAAVVVTTAERSGKGGKRPAAVIGAGFSTTHLHLSAASSLTRMAPVWHLTGRCRSRAARATISTSPWSTTVSRSPCSSMSRISALQQRDRRAPLFAAVNSNGMDDCRSIRMAACYRMATPAERPALEI